MKGKSPLAVALRCALSPLRGHTATPHVINYELGMLNAELLCHPKNFKSEISKLVKKNFLIPNS